MTASDSSPPAGGPSTAGIRPGFVALLRTLEAASRDRADSALAVDAEASIERVVRALVSESGTQDRPELAGAAMRVLEARGSAGFDSALATLLALLHRYVAAVSRGGQGFRVLVVEDDALAAGTVNAALAWAGHAVVIAPTVADARRELQGPAFDLVVLDLLLPDGDGRNLLQSIRSEPRLSAIPVFVVSARLGQQTRSECFALGADAYFEKPLDLEAFAVAVESRLVRQTHQRLQSRRDAVTGLPNRAAFLEAAATLPPSGDEVGATLAVLDLDHFRWVEETWGRQFAEGVLRRVGVRLAMSLRAASCFARWDGAEFVALFPRKTPVEVSGLVERALAGLRRLDFRAGTTPALSITFSAGLAAVRAGVTATDALAQADRLCFTAKTSGRNRVVTEGSDSTIPSRRILLAEDDPRISDLLVRQLRREGFEVVAYPNGAEALAAAPESGAALVITDLEMPELDGLGLLRGLREHPLTRHLPAMVLTAMGDENHIVRAFELGADDYVLKPFTIREVAARLRRLLRRPTSAGVPLTVG